MNDIHCIDGEVPKTYMSRETADIGQFCDLAWYNWIMCSLVMIDYTDEPLHQGKYLTLTIDMGPAMPTKILQHNCKVVYQSTYRPLTIEEKLDLTIQLDMNAFKETTEEGMGIKLMHNKLEEIGMPDMLEYMPYDDEDQNNNTYPDLDEEVMSEVGNEYVHASVLFLYGSQMMHITVKECKKK